MRKNRPSRRSRRNGFTRLFGGSSKELSRAPRRRTLERLEERQVLSANVGGNPYFEDQWHLDANGQQTEFDPTSPTRFQTLAEIDNNVVEAWEQLITGAGVQVGIISGGFDLAHEDLVGAFATNLAVDVLGSTFNPDGSLTEDVDTLFTDPTDSSGTAIAGIIGARNNDLGIVGIAYEADLVPIRAVPGDLDGETATAQSNAAALRWRLGMVQDVNGDGIVDGVDNDGDGIVDGLASDDVIDVYFVSGDINPDDGNRTANFLDPELRSAIEDGFNQGRARWDDLDGDGVFDLDETTALGAIYVVPAGSDNGVTFDIADATGSFGSSQYNELASSRYTIAVGAVDYDGRYENNSTGTVTSFAEIGPNVLIVAPSSTDQIDLAADGDLNSGILTTDITGENGQNRLPVFNNEIDGDFFPDTNYTSTFGGTEAAAAQVTAVVAQMLEANPNLTNRDVEMILLMSAQQTDLFSETWVTNPFTYFVDEISYVVPQWIYYDLDTNGDGEADIVDAVLPNTPLINVDAFDQDVIRAFFSNNPDLTVDFLGTVDVTDIPTDDEGNRLEILRSNLPIFFDDQINPERLHIFPDGLGDANIRTGIDDLLSPGSASNVPLQFENGVGFTVSSGYGRYLEEIGYAHGLLDAGLAVELASRWGVDDTISGDSGLYKGRSVTISTPIEDGSLSSLAIQARADISLGNNLPTFTVPGGLNTQAINQAFFSEFTVPIGTTDVDFVGDFSAEVITDVPFYDPDGNDNFNLNRGPSFLPISIDQSVDFDFLSLEWLEFRAQFDTGDIDHIRVSILSPDGTQTELNPYRLPAGASEAGLTFQRTQFGQGYQIPGIETLGGGLGNFNAENPDFIDGSEINEIIGVEVPDAVANDETWVWTTNRHYGELFSVEASFNANDSIAFNERDRVDDVWYLVIENWNDGAASLNGTQITVHGTEVTGQRIQGKIGVDDNAQNVDFYNTPLAPGGSVAQNPTPEQLGDGVFNFNRHLELGELFVDPTPNFDPISGFLIPDGDEQTLLVVVDDAGDSVDFDELDDTFRSRSYRTFDPDTGIEYTYPVVDRDAYLTANTDDLASNLAEFDASFGGSFVTPDARQTDGLVDVFGAADGTPSTYQNFDYSQETFAAGVTVLSTQYQVVYDAAGNPTTRTPTGQIQRFVTGADGNYYFDVDSIIPPPDPALDPSGYANWFNDFGFTYEYDISVVGEDERLWDRAYTLDAQEDASSQVAYNGSGVYTVQLFDNTEVLSGVTTTVRDVNFLLAVDLAEVRLTVSGDVIRDLNGDGVLDPTDGIYAGIRVYVDANDNGVFDPGEIEALTDASGAYTFEFDPGGDDTVTIRLDPTTYPEPLRAITPINAQQEAELVLTNFDPGDNIADQDFFLKPTASFVTGAVWQDTDEDGVFDPEENAVDGTALGVDGTNAAVFVYFDANNDGEFNAGDVRADVDASGNYNLEFVNPGTYVIRIDTTNADFSQTFPFAGGAQFVTLLAEETSEGVNFGVKDQRVFDYGDLPDSYGTLLGSDGARHRVTGNVYLGAAAPDLELNGQPTINSDGDDNDGNDDEDGVKFASVDVQANSTVEFDITATGGGALLNAWVDFNNNGVFEASEQVFDDVANLGTGIETRISAPTPATVADADRYAARFRWGPFGLDPTGAANDGEVEDLWLTPDAIIVSGEVRRDADNDAIFEGSDSPRAGVRVFFDKDLDGVRDPDEPSSVTNGAGQYSFEVTPNGNDTPITIRIEEPTLAVNEGFLDPTDGIIADLGDPGELITANFLLTSLPRPTQAITGTVFSDLNNNGVFNTPAEGGFDGITVELLQNIDGDPALEVIQTTTTNPSGIYSFGVENTGVYEVRIVLPAGGTLVQTTPGGDTVEVAVTTGSTVTAPLFGVFDVRSTYTRDYGDLRVGGADNYPTTVLQEGPSHLVVEGIFLGAGVDADSGQLTSSNGSADDNDFTDDEDGVILLSEEIVAGGAIEFDVTATGEAASRLNMWVDFDDNGVFDADEQIVTDLAIVSGVTTQINRVANADTSPTATLLAVRTRWGTAGVGPDDVGLSDAEKAAIVGEVEDQFVRTSQPGVLVAPIVGDFDGSGVVDQADEQFWRASYGMVGAGLGADANGNGRIDAGDYTVWRDAFANAQAAAAFAAASAPVVEQPAPVAEEPAAVPPVVTMPIEEEILEPVSYDANAFAPMALLTATQTAAVDESLSIEEETADAAADAIAAALLEWSFEGVAEQDDEEVETGSATDDESEDPADAALAEAFAL